MNALLDVNIVLDVLLERAPWAAESSAVWRACDEGRLEGYVAAVTVTNVWYLTRRIKGPERARESVAICLRAFQIAATYRETLDAALQMPGSDFEDNVQIATARTSLLDVIVTRDRKGFAASAIPALTPAELLARLSIEG